jgi:predicted metalloprotease
MQERDELRALKSKIKMSRKKSKEKNMCKEKKEKKRKKKKRRERKKEEWQERYEEDVMLLRDETFILFSNHVQSDNGDVIGAS